jgi:hypothetical protein
VEFIDPETQARVSLLGVFHGTASSAQDVQTIMAQADTDVVVLELCASRFVDLQKEQERLLETAAAVADKQLLPPRQRSWLVRYAEMIVQTVRTKGLPTGMAAALLGGFSGLQSAMSGFVPGLEFTTALDLCMRKKDGDSASNGKAGIDIVLADQAVDETLRKLGNLGGTASDIFLWERRPDGQRSRRSLASAAKECQLHLTTLQQAVFGGSGRDNDQSLPQVNLPSVLLRNSAAVQDLVRLALPSTLLVAVTSQLFATMLGESSELEAILSDVDGFSRAIQFYAETRSLSMDVIQEWLGHVLASGLILSSGALAAVPVVKTILTERDEILTSGIRTACRRAGENGRVVAVLVSAKMIRGGCSCCM